MIQFKLRHAQQGGHVWVRVFTRKLPTETWARLGELTMNGEDWLAFKAIWGGNAFCDEDES